MWKFDVKKNRWVLHGGSPMPRAALGCCGLSPGIEIEPRSRDPEITGVFTRRQWECIRNASAKHRNRINRVLGIINRCLSIHERYSRADPWPILIGANINLQTFSGIQSSYQSPKSFDTNPRARDFTRLMRYVENVENVEKVEIDTSPEL
jgi:hypothetical protein